MPRDGLHSDQQIDARSAIGWLFSPKEDEKVSEFWWALLWLTFFIPMMFLWGFTLVDIFTRHDIHAVSKGLWAIGVVVFPLVGMLIYFIARPKDVATMPMGYSGAYDASGYPYSASDLNAARYAGTPAINGPTDLDALRRLHDQGSLSDDEYKQITDRVLDSTSEPRSA
jgi:hypothetical protein